ncbi:hypothetical protein [Micromonospora tulbaghiae]|uniref:hypothetical protein n=1 Tax=Micromonospora tulbaghiae TaxID=479978 RepID=UPI00197C8ABC|nr:hypothetical protein [Micromonospora tulbaghiae]
MVATTNTTIHGTSSAIAYPASHSNVAAYQPNAPLAWASNAVLGWRPHNAR